MSNKSESITTHNGSKARKGLSLTEVVISSLLVGTVVLGSLVMLGASVHTSRVADGLRDGPVLADALLAEIMSMPYEDPESPGGPIGTDGSELISQRTAFDDVDDYNGWSQSPPRLSDNTQLNDFAGWTRAATVEWADVATGDQSFVETGLKRVLVTVTDPSGAVTSRLGMRSRNGALEQAPIADRNVVTFVEMSLQVGSSGKQVRSATNLLNHVEAPGSP